MAITPPYNDIEMKTAWAEDAATTIPSVPVPGISYRNTAISDETIANGQAYDNIGRSADWNQLLYKISANIVTMQKQGASLLWVSGRNYEQGALVKDPNNAQIYYRLKAGAGTTRPSSDSTNWQLLQSFFMGEGLVLTNNKINWGLTGATVSDCNDISTSGIFRATSSTENIPTDTAGSVFNGIIVCFHTATILQQIAYETTNNGAFSMNTRISVNSGSTWSAWTRFGVEFTLDWRSGGDYRAGDLVRDTSNSLLYVCTTAINNSTQRPGLDTTHFKNLAAWLCRTDHGLMPNGATNEDTLTWGYSGNSITDCNDITYPGVYYCLNTTENIPSSSSSSQGILISVQNGNAATTNNYILLQLFLQASTNARVYCRLVSINVNGVTTFNQWRELSKFDSLDFVSGQTYNQGQLVRGSNNIHYVKKTAASVCTTEPNSDSTNFETLAQNLVGEGLLVSGGKMNFGLSISEVTDFDDAILPGTYSFSSAAANSPSTTAAGVLLVMLSGANTESRYRQQVAFYYDGHAYMRRYDKNNTAFNDWREIGPDTISASDLAGNGLTAASNKLNWGTNVAQATNLNNVSTPGVYNVTAAGVSNKPGGSTSAGSLMVISRSTGITDQLFFDTVNGALYSRSYFESKWSSWVTVTNGIGANMSTGKQNRSFGTTYTAATDGFVELTAYSNWRANTNGQLYINGNEIAVNHTGQYGSGGQSSGVQTTIYVRAGDQYRCNQGSLEYYWWFPNN